jgi:5-methylcytosine-specific restriction endonuclease McrA
MTYIDPYGASVAAVLITTDARRGTTNRNVRGSAESRRRRKVWLLQTFGDGQVAECSFCSRLVDFDSITVDRFPTPGCQGGTYRRDNIRPACGPCNSTHGGALRAS